MSVEIEAEDVIRLVLQFLKENDLQESALALELETTVKINTLENKEAFIKTIKEGEWDVVLRHVVDLKIPPRKLMDLYEQVVLELTELRELGAARTLLRQTEPMFILKQRHPERYLRLEHTLSRSMFDPKDNYPNGMTKEKRRNVIAQALASEVAVVEPARLITLLEDCIKWQQHQGLLPLDTKFDLFRSSDGIQSTEEDAFADKEYSLIKFPGKNTYAECTTFSPNGQNLITGSVDGFIEVWNYLTGKLRKDLKYQAEENLMSMDQSVISLDVSQDSELLATGSTDGKIAVWKLQSGICTRRFSPAHSQGVTSVCFNKEANHILSGSYDHSVKIHHVKSGKLVKSFEGHTSFVNSVLYNWDNTLVLSASSNGEIKIWDVTSGSCLSTTTPQRETSVQLLLSIPSDMNHFIAVTKSSTLFIMTEKGKVIKTISHPDAKDFISATVSHGGKLVYAVSEESIMYSFQIATGDLVGQKHLCKAEVIGISCHPFTNVIASNDETGLIHLLKHE
ncbi:smu-1 suppressor of mec-8 and unc-52 [Mucor mucedo]|uniref:smu-1 suppressor of mec-8 and unc-52 n=1 Tax=Mucor mucedo TaxID=29922 RepID=UPI00221F5198|nr:smu-1 suppressor of mec-8 and unc-52 [Mucor mucedo]KAI7887829.1 smu-1 suppressor of mec-8 and unc-52 [Mucor mucedo]